MGNKTRLYAFPCENQREPWEVFAPLARQPYSLFLDSADRKHELARHSYVVFAPLETIESKNGRVCVTNRDQQFTFDADPFRVLQDRLDVYGFGRQARPDLPPFQGGAAGFFGYDLVRGLEDIKEGAADNPAVPDMAAGIYDQVFAFDHARSEGVYLVHAADEEAAKMRHAHFLRLLSLPCPRARAVPGEGQWTGSHTRKEYEQAVRRVIDYIHAGDIFQANLSHRFEAVLPEGFDPWRHYLSLRTVNAAPFAAFMNFGGLVLSSASPERFLSVRGRQAETRPIKGTAERADVPALDQFYRNALENSAKDRAENTMIVDLMRNDLSKVCEDHSIDAPQLCHVESFARLHHLVSIVTGTLRADRSALDLLRACFPGGSITGAPKVRAMEIIESLEGKRRGPYCGAMGYIGFDGTMDTNIAIRTLVYESGKVSFNVGGGIVADSVPEKEYAETMAKAEAIFMSFETEAQAGFESENALESRARIV